MKIVSSILRVLAVLLAVATLAAFFFPFATLTVTNGSETINGLQCAFGGEVTAEIFGAGMQVYKGLYFVAALILVAVTAIFMAVGLFSKKKGWNGAALVFGVLAAIVMLVVFFANRPAWYVDTGLIANVAVEYTLYTMLAMIGSIASVVVCTAGVLAQDAVLCKETGELTIPRKILKFLREYKSELKKVVWPGPRSVLKNTLVVLGFCAVALIIIWLADWGLGELFNLCFGIEG